MGQRLLAIDVGNSRVKAALFEDGRLVKREALAPVADWEDAARVLRDCFEQKPERCLIASVVRRAGSMVAQAVQAVWGIVGVVVDAKMDLGIQVAVPHPDAVGIDRLLEASAAFEVAKDAVVVAALGSAITVDLVSAEGIFRGGTILPGLRMGFRALHSETSLLPFVDAQHPDSVLGTDTQSCIRAGVIYGAAGAVDRIYAELVALEPASLIVTGGDLDLLAPFIQSAHRVEADLVLRGLASLDSRKQRADA